VTEWGDDIVAQVRAAVDSARIGGTAVLVFSGAPGAGRTSVLQYVREQAVGFDVRTSTGVSGGSTAFRTLADLGVSTAPNPQDGFSEVIAARRLRDLVDDVVAEAPMLVLLDDVHWIDPESMRVVAELLERAEGVPLLVAASTGMLEPGVYLRWQQLLATSPIVTEVPLEGLPIDVATRVMRDLRPSIDDALAGHIWRLTTGNPMFITSLLRRYEPAELRSMQRLPAPVDFALELFARMSAWSPAALALSRAAAVLGTGWLPLAQVASVADAPDPLPALAELTDEFLVFVRQTGDGTAIRLRNAVVYASVYEHTPADERVRLHRRAARVVEDEYAEFEHLVAATVTADDALAARLAEGAARVAHDRDHRTAARYFRWAARVSGDGRTRGRLLLDGAYEAVLSGDLAAGEDPALARARDQRRVALVRGMLAVARNDVDGAVRVLQPTASSDLPDDELTTYRTNVLLGWSSMVAGAAAEQVRPMIERFEHATTRDDALAGFATITAAMIDRRQHRQTTIAGQLGRLAERPAAVPPDDTYWLAWRGFSAVLYGRAAEAIGPLSEVDTRMATGFVDVGDGLTRAFLGYAHWLTGELDRADIAFRTARERLRPRANPMTASFIAIGRVGRGDQPDAAELLNGARAVLVSDPWDEAVNVHLMATVTYLHAFGTPAARADFLPSFRSDFGRKATDVEGNVSPMWKVQAAIACIWADDLDEADRIVASLAASLPSPSWIPAAVDWLAALVAEERGSTSVALQLARRAAEHGLAPLELFGAHLQTDLARIATAAGDRGTAIAARAAAQTVYRRAGLVAYLDQEAPAASPVVSVFEPLSERERDVAALLVTGMSYAQIARELFITRSTVGFHLSRIYAKTGTTSRHELSELVRAAA
jgi:DNA-binding CsgD family transcriptional regulator